MSSVVQRRGIAVVLLAVAAVMAGCASQSAAEKAAEVEAARQAAELAARTPPPVALNQGVAEAASIYVAFARDISAMQGGFNDPEAIQAAIRRGTAYDPAQLSRGLVAYAAIVALQSPEFVQGVRQYAGDRTTREQLAANIVADPRWASHLPGAEAGAGMIMAALRTDIDAMSRAADSIENDAYAIQSDSRRSWGVAHVVNREARLAAAKARSAEAMLPSGPDAARLLAAAHNGSGLGLSADRLRQAPYPPVVERALAIAALAALGEAGAQTRTDPLQNDPVSQTCLAESKLNLFQCLAASRPSYEDVFCLGRHIVRDIATCTRGAAMPAAVVTVSPLTVAGPQPPRITPAPLENRPPAPSSAPSSSPAAPPVVRTPVAPAVTPTERLNTGPG
ncbi:MAG: hypothetical protein EON88_26260 [Brevundimonas sp.]|nr:MAG: hypothetical protein EON88_26260 [Brevundimonas sp.]